MNTNYNKLLVVLAVILLVGGAYVYFSNGLSVQAATDSPLTSSASNKTTSSNLAITSAKISEDTAFLSTLTSLTRIKIDKTLFDDPSFKMLNDNTVVLDPSPTGRPNPFAPINPNASTATAPVSPVVTNVPTQITTTTALLNGTTNNVPGVTSAYFDYGPTPTLGKSTPSAKQSLIGTFGANITGLTKGTTYFYRAVAKIGGTLRYGDIISFTTN